MTPLPNEIIFISGQRGSGKSYFAKKLAASLPRCLIWDSLGEYQADTRIYELEELGDFLTKDQQNPRLFTVAFDSYEPDVTFPWFCRLALARGSVYVVMEELDLLATPQYCPPDFARLIKYGRHFGIQLVGISRRPAEVSRLFTSQASRFVIFSQREPRDLQYFRSLIGNAADQLPNLTGYHHLDVDFSGTPDFMVKPPI